MFLLRRNLPLAYQGYYDGFNRTAETPVKQPWGMWGEMDADAFISTNELNLPPAPTGKAGGVSFEFQPFTKCYGLEYEVIWPVSGPGDQFLQLFIMPNWSIVGPDLNNSLGVRLMHQSVGAGDSVRIQQWNTPTSLGTDVATNGSPVPLDGSVPLHLRVWVEDDQFVAVWVNDTITCAGMLSPTFKTGPGRRGMNLMQFSVTTARYQFADVYDREPSCPDATHWSPTFTDDFNRSDGAVGNGWTVFDTAGQIVSGSYTTTGGSDGSRAILRDSGITSGYQRISAVVGGAKPPNNSADASLILRANSAGTQALACNVYGDRFYLSYLSGGTLASPTWTDFNQTSNTLASGDVVTFSAWGDWCWVEVNGVRRAYALNISSVAPQTNSDMGLRVARKPFNDSHSWDSVSFYSGF
ncbi:hypothetical protein [Nocardia abscessus]|uniref:hypothetical protein n=1 Tax=Nocardia abscessus TaxID=120957 RepID=UPI002458745C|nr:hypothetical protein [Nocardia abscessus]